MVRTVSLPWGALVYLERDLSLARPHLVTHSVSLMTPCLGLQSPIAFRALLLVPLDVRPG